MRDLTAAYVLSLGPCQDWREGGIDRYLAGRTSVPVREVLLDERRELISTADRRWLALSALARAGTCDQPYLETLGQIRAYAANRAKVALAAAGVEP
jgi:hypothetical protein